MIGVLHSLSLMLAFILPMQGIFQIGSEITYAVKYALIAVLWGGYIVFKLCDKTDGKVKVHRLVVWLFGLIFVYVILSLISILINGGDPFSYFEVLLTALSLSLAPLYIGIGNLYDDKEVFVRKHVKAFVYGALIVVCVSFVYYLFRFTWILPEDFLNRSRRLYGMVKSPNALAVLSFVGCLCAALGVYKHWYRPVVGVLIIAIFSSAFLLTLSKATYIAAFASFIAAFLYLYKLSKKIAMKYLIVFSIMLFISIIFAAGIYSWKSPPKITFNESSQVLDALRIKSNVFDTGNRLVVWSAGLDVVDKNPLFGIGVHNWMEELAKRGLVGYDSPHNGFLELAGGLGVFGAILYVWTPLFLFISVARRGRSIYKVMIISVLVLYYVRELVEVSSVFSYAIPGMSFWLLMGLFLLPITYGQNKLVCKVD